MQVSISRLEKNVASAGDVLVATLQRCRNLMEQKPFDHTIVDWITIYVLLTGLFFQHQGYGHDPDRSKRIHRKSCV